MYHTLDEFFQQYDYERQSTQKIMAALTDASLAQPVAKDHRTLGRLAWHIVLTYPDMAGPAGVPIKSVDKDAPVPASAAAISQSYQQVTEELVDHIKKHWSDSTMAEVKEFYGEQWSNALMLSILIRHEGHHRGQLTILMRQAGLNVPGVYGPSYEEWSGYGQNPPEV